MTEPIDLIGARCLHTNEACDVKLGELILATNSDGESVLIKVEPETRGCDMCHFYSTNRSCPKWKCGFRNLIFVKVAENGCT